MSPAEGVKTEDKKPLWAEIPLSQTYEDILSRAEIDDSFYLRVLLSTDEESVTQTPILDFYTDEDGWIKFDFDDSAENWIMTDLPDYVYHPVEEWLPELESDMNYLTPPLFVDDIRDKYFLGDELLAGFYQEDLQKSLLDFQEREGILRSPKEHPISSGMDANKIIFLVNKYPSFDFWAYQSIKMAQKLSQMEPGSDEATILSRYALYYYAPIMRFFEVPYIVYLLEQNSFRLLEPDSYEKSFQMSASLNGFQRLRGEDTQAPHLDNYEKEWGYVEELRNRMLSDFLHLNPQLNPEDIEVHARLKSSLSLALKVKEGRPYFDNIALTIVISDEAVAREVSGAEIDELTLFDIQEYVGSEGRVFYTLARDGRPRPSDKRRAEMTRNVGVFLVDSINRLVEYGDHEYSTLGEEIQNTYDLKNRPSHNPEYTVVDSNLDPPYITGSVELRVTHASAYAHQLANHPAYKALHGLKRYDTDWNKLVEQGESLRRMRELSTGSRPTLFELSHRKGQPLSPGLKGRIKHYRDDPERRVSTYLSTSNGTHTIPIRKTRAQLIEFKSVVAPSVEPFGQFQADTLSFDSFFIVSRVVRSNSGYVRKMYIYNSQGTPVNDVEHPLITQTDQQYVPRDFDQITHIYKPEVRDGKLVINRVKTVSSMMRQGDFISEITSHFEHIPQKYLEEISQIEEKLDRYKRIWLRSINSSTVIPIQLYQKDAKQLTDRLRTIVQNIYFQESMVNFYQIFLKRPDAHSAGFLGKLLRDFSPELLRDVELRLSSFQEKNVRRFFDSMFLFEYDHDTLPPKQLLSIAEDSIDGGIIFNSLRAAILSQLKYWTLYYRSSSRFLDDVFYGRVTSSEKINSYRKLLQALKIDEEAVKNHSISEDSHLI